MNTKRASIGIIGYGRFGALMHSVLARHKPEYQILIHDPALSRTDIKQSTLEQVAVSDIIIPCVPIAEFENTIRAIAPLIGTRSLVLDVCSVKQHPVDCMLRLLPDYASCVSSHPMFGPATYQKRLEANHANPLKGLTMVLHNVRAPEDRYNRIKAFLESLELSVIEMAPDEHDKIAARFHFICLTAATVLKKLDIPRSAIDTESASRMLDFLEMISVDPRLVKDLYQYNPYCKEQLKAFAGAFNEFVSFIEGTDSVL